MRTTVFAVLVGLVAAIAAQPALARGGHHHSHSHFSIGFGFGYPYWGSPWGPWWYPPPYYYPPAAVVVRPAEPVTYIEKGNNDSQGWWYYCDASRGYYPYVKECPSGWQRVPPAPAK
jgi:hypothetical protein